MSAASIGRLNCDAIDGSLLPLFGPPNPKRNWATRRIWISSAPSVIRYRRWWR